MKRMNHVLALMLFVLFLFVFINPNTTPVSVVSHRYIASMIGFSPGSDIEPKLDHHFASKMQVRNYLEPNKTATVLHASLAGLCPG